MELKLVCHVGAPESEELVEDEAAEVVFALRKVGDLDLREAAVDGGAGVSEPALGKGGRQRTGGDKLAQHSVGRIDQTLVVDGAAPVKLRQQSVCFGGDGAA